MAAPRSDRGFCPGCAGQPIPDEADPCSHLLDHEERLEEGLSRPGFFTARMREDAEKIVESLQLKPAALRRRGACTCR